MSLRNGIDLGLYPDDDLADQTEGSPKATDSETDLAGLGSHIGRGQRDAEVAGQKDDGARGGDDSTGDRGRNLVGVGG